MLIGLLQKELNALVQGEIGPKTLSSALLDLILRQAIGRLDHFRS